MINEILNELDWSENAEITLELNPTDVTFEKLKKLNKIGINRLSIGIQSFQDHVLKFIGRQHSSDDAINVYKMAREAGFCNITVDLMFGIPNQSLEDLQRDLDILRELKPENVSIYSLIWEEGTVFWSKLQKGQHANNLIIANKKFLIFLLNSIALPNIKFNLFPCVLFQRNF